jgi:transposase-like protein
MTETIYMMGERHPQSTKLFNGRPLTKGNYATRAELEEAVLDRHNRGYGCRRISRIVGVSDTTVATIIKQWKEKQNASSLWRLG